MEQAGLRELRSSDLDDVVAVHCAAFPTSAMTKLGTETVKRYYLWQLVGPHEMYASGAWIDSRLVGFCFGGEQPTSISGFVSHNKAYLAWRLLTHPWLVVNPLYRGRLSHALRLVSARRRKNAKSIARGEPRKKHAYDILSIAVHPELQGRGVGKQLLARAQEQAEQNGFNVMTLFVHRDNEQAIHFYERCGWERSNKNGVWRGTMVKWLKRDAAQAPVQHGGNSALSSA